MLLDQMAINGMASSSSSSPFFPPNFLLQIQNNNHHDPQEDHQQLHHHHHHHNQAPSPLSSLLSSNPQDYRSMATMLGKRSMSFSGGIEAAGCEDGGGGGGGEDDLSDDCSGLAGEKKRRLSIEQVRTLEKNFEIGNKLEPDRKVQLARALGLQPRQVAIWFQNRRARWKTKQLEKDYDVLKRQFEAVKSENEALHAHNNKLQAEISFLKGGRETTSELINLNKETEGSCSNRSENSSEINLDISRAAHAIESPPNPNQSIPFFPTTSIRPPPTMVQLLQSTTAAAALCPKIEHNAVHDENFSNLLCSMDDQSAFWPWSDPHSFH